MKLMPKRVAQFKRVGYLNIEKRLIDDEHLTVLRQHYDALFAQKRDTIGEGCVTSQSSGTRKAMRTLIVTKRCCRSWRCGVWMRNIGTALPRTPVRHRRV